MARAPGDDGAATRPSAVATGLAHWSSRRPDAEAVGDGSRALTFAELDGRAGTLARVLHERTAAHRGAAADAVAVPVLVGRDIASVVALHGLLRAGVAAAPIDARLPAEVIAQTIARLGQPPFAVTADEQHRARVPAGIETIDVPTAIADPLPPQAVEPDAPALVVFTSGSTGHPKGVVLAWAMLDQIFDSPVLAGVDADARCAVLSPLHWRGGINRVLAPSRGAALLVVPAEVTDQGEMLERVDRWGVTHLPGVPSQLVAVAAHWPAGRRLGTVRVVRLLGEALHWEQVPLLQRILPTDAQIICSYGATEASGGLVEFVIDAGTPPGSGPVPLGYPPRPDRLRLEPIGDNADEDDARYEIVATGTVASGYLGDPALTAARFGIDADGTRWWRTGDLVQRAADGCLSHRGRIDDMVKIRGRLVEPAEPERVLSTLPGVASASVVPHTTERGGTRLVAHLVLEPDSTLTSGGVRSTLAGALPPHLVPSPLMVHDDLPRTPIGKIDRVALRTVPIEPWRSAPVGDPFDDLEATVVIVCAEVLALDVVAPDDDLWELGLDSLEAVELVAAMSELGWGTVVPSALLEHTTPAALASMLRDRARRSHDPRRPSEIVVLNGGGDRSPIIALPGAGETAFAFHWIARALGPAQPVVVVEPRGLHTSGRPDRTIEAMAARAAPTAVARGGDAPAVLVGHSAGGLVAFATAQRLRRTGHPVGVVMLDTPFPGTPRVARNPGGTAPAHRRRLARTARQPMAALRRLRTETAVAVRAQWPGPPSMRPARYAAFTRIGADAARRYRPEPGDFPVVLLHPVDSHAAATWRGWDTQVDPHAVGGNHLTMLRPPAVDDVVAQILALQGRMGRARADR